MKITDVLTVVAVKVPLAGPGPGGSWGEVPVESWLAQDMRDDLDEGPVGLYEFIWTLNGSPYELAPHDAIKQAFCRCASWTTAPGSARRPITGGGHLPENAQPGHRVRTAPTPQSYRSAGGTGPG